jgi:crotonobetainyl-CoA:carnitine CoA-transferase CaiB-like acyl-CoA transferase
MPAYGIFPVADGYVALGVIVEQHFWDATCRALGLDDLVGIGIAEQLGRDDEVRARITAALAPWTRDEVVERLLAEGAPISPVLSRAEVVADEHLRSRGIVVEGRHGPAFGHPVLYADHPARPPGPLPAPDEHAAEGFSPR